MNAADLLKSQFQRMHDGFLRTLDGLGDEQLIWQPKPRANSIGFLLWHLLRAWDVYQAQISGGDELYEKDVWPGRFGFDTSGRGRDGSNMGTGFTPEDVAAVQARPVPLSEYLESLWSRTGRYLDAATGDLLASEVNIPWWPGPASRARVLSHILAHSYQHLGEAQYVRGLLSG